MLLLYSRQQVCTNMIEKYTHRTSDAAQHGKSIVSPIGMKHLCVVPRRQNQHKLALTKIFFGGRDQQGATNKAQPGSGASDSSRQSAAQTTALLKFIGRKSQAGEIYIIIALDSRPSAEPHVALKVCAAYTICSAKDTTRERSPSPGNCSYSNRSQFI
jgi:hypothetical protein